MEVTIDYTNLQTKELATQWFAYPESLRKQVPGCSVLDEFFSKVLIE